MHGGGLADGDLKALANDFAKDSGIASELSVFEGINSGASVFQFNVFSFVDDDFPLAGDILVLDFFGNGESFGGEMDRETVGVRLELTLNSIITVKYPLSLYLI